MKRLLAALSPLVLLATPAPSLDLATDAKDRVLRNLPANSAAQPASGEWAFAVSNGQAAIEQRQKLKQTGNPCGGPCGETGGPASGSIGTSQSGTVSGDAIAKNGVAAGWGHNQGITSAAVSHSGASATNGHSVQTGSTAQVIR
jgi:hypothetical protein